MTLVPFEDAAEIADRFIALLAENQVAPATGSSYEAELLSLVQLLEVARDPSLAPADHKVDVLRTAAGVHDLAAKVLAVADQPEFARLMPHLRLVAGTPVPAATLTQNRTALYNDDTSRKLAELYFACLAISFAHDVVLDHPTSSRGDNPDVMFDVHPADGSPSEQWALAIKTISAKSGQTIFERIKEGAAQIDAPLCTAVRGLVVINARDAIDHDALWSASFHDEWDAAAALRGQLEAIAHSADQGRPKAEWDSLFIGRAEPPVLFLGQSLVTLSQPCGDRLPTPVKVLLAWGADRAVDPYATLVAGCLNQAMQRLVWGKAGTHGVAPT